MARNTVRRHAHDDDSSADDYFDEEDYADDPEDEEEEESPRRRRDARRDRSTRPGGRRRPPAASADEDDEDEDESPRRFRRRSEDRSRRSSGRTRERTVSRRPAGERGWSGVEKLRSSGYAENLKVGEDEIVIKFLEPEPYISFRQHWIKEIKTGKRSFVCLEEDCPLCDQLGHHPSKQVYFNVADLSDPEKPEVKTWAMGIRLAQKIRKLSEKPRTSPLNRKDLYWVVSKSGEGTSTEYNLQAIYEEDLDYWKVEPLSSEELDELMEQCQGPEDVRWDSREELEALADELA